MRHCGCSVVKLVIAIVLCVCFCVLPQNAECLAFVSVPVPLPGYHLDSFGNFVSCVPLSACPGVDVSALVSGSGGNVLSLTQYLKAVNSTYALEANASFSSSSSGSVNPTANSAILLQYYNKTDVNSLPSECAYGYTGSTCETCLSGFYRLESACKQCPVYAFAYIIAFFGSLAVILGVIVYCRKKHVNMTALSVGVDFMQIVSIFSSFGFAWPSALHSVFTAASAAALNDQLLAPECSVAGWSLTRKWLAVQIIPGLFILALLVLAAMNKGLMLFHRYVRGKKQNESRTRNRFAKLLDAYCGFVIAIVYTLYFSVVKGALSIFNCVQNESGVRVMVAYPSEVCGQVRAPS